MYGVRSDAIEWRIPTSVNVTARILMLFLTVSKILRFEMFELKILVKVTECNIRTGLVRWRISTSIKVMLEHFSLALIVFKFCDLEKVV